MLFVFVHGRHFHFKYYGGVFFYTVEKYNPPSRKKTRNTHKIYNKCALRVV